MLAWSIAHSTSRVSSGHVDMAAGAQGVEADDLVGRQHQPGGAGEVDDAGELGDGEAIEVAAVPLDGVVDPAAGHLDRIERVLDVGGVALAQGVHVQRRGRQQEHGEDDQAVADRDGDGRRGDGAGDPAELEPGLEAGERAGARRHRGVGLDHRVEALAGHGGDATEHERHEQHERA